MQTSPFAPVLRKHQTDAEKLLWSKLRNRQILKIKFSRQHPIPPYIVDFVCLEHRLVVELDGGGHTSDKAKMYDTKRTNFLENKGYFVLRFWNNDILKYTDEVMDIILSHITNPHPDLFPGTKEKETKV
jgi:very-short-patch-repair endonuclease